MDWTTPLRAQVELAASRALGEQDASPHSVTAGCFDRRYWAWKLVDFPEATFQRLVLPLAALYRDPASRFHTRPEVLASVRSGLACAASLQHRNGSFDQAFPFEQSYGATAFLVYPLIEAARLIDDQLPTNERASIDNMARRGAEFLATHEEAHGVISNHLAGSALSLLAAADRFNEARFASAADAIVDGLLARQAAEGWFPEYGGADPGYQTLCLDYLSAIAQRRPSARLDAGLDRGLEFLKWFVHPDGSFGGLYGSRRTSLVYLGGLARLSARSAVAAALCNTLGASMGTGDIAGPATIDAGNLAPLLTSAVAALATSDGSAQDPVSLPCDTVGATVDFPEAGIHVRSAAGYYAICGAANGGTISVFSRVERRLLLDDGGYVAQTGDGTRVTTQATSTGPAKVTSATIELDVPFVRMPSAMPTPARFVALRVLNLTLMRSIAIGNWVKRRLVAMLVTSGQASSLRLKRRITFGAGGVTITDRIENPDGQSLAWLRGGQPFSGIHMASSGYFHPVRLGTAQPGTVVDVQRLAHERAVELTTTV